MRGRQTKFNPSQNSSLTRRDLPRIPSTVLVVVSSVGVNSVCSSTPTATALISACVSVHVSKAQSSGYRTWPTHRDALAHILKKSKHLKAPMGDPVPSDPSAPETKVEDTAAAPPTGEAAAPAAPEVCLKHREVIECDVVFSQTSAPETTQGVPAPADPSTAAAPVPAAEVAPQVPGSASAAPGAKHYASDLSVRSRLRANRTIQVCFDFF